MTTRRALRIAAAQLVPAATVELGLADVGAVLDVAGPAGTHLVVFPELTLTGYDLDRLDHDESWLQPDDRRLDPIRDRCLRHGMAAVINAGQHTVEGRRLLASTFIQPNGDIVVSGKQHLHGRERELFDAAEPLPPIELQGWQISLAVCFDVAVPRHAQMAAAAGADLYAVSAFYGSTERQRMAIQLAARAMDHRMYAVVANAASRPGHADSCGGSGVWGPDGGTIMRVGTNAAVVRAELDPHVLVRWRDHDRLATG